MTFWERVTGQQNPEPPKKERFFAVWLTWDYTRVEYWPDVYRPHFPGDHTIEIQRDGRREPAARYNEGGWVKCAHVMLVPGPEVNRLRGDRYLP
jgi:hypothetical protein